MNQFTKDSLQGPHGQQPVARGQQPAHQRPKGQEQVQVARQRDQFTNDRSAPWQTAALPQVDLSMNVYAG